MGSCGRARGPWSVVVGRGCPCAPAPAALPRAQAQPPAPSVTPLHCESDVCRSVCVSVVSAIWLFPIVSGARHWARQARARGCGATHSKLVSLAIDVSAKSSRSPLW
eukprot:4100290-Prymnesium_polylepis.1